MSETTTEGCTTCLGCPDCGPVSTKRTVEAIAHRMEKVSEGPWTAWDRGIGYEVHGPHGEPINDRCRETFSRGDAEFIAMAPGDVHYLLTELRKARKALDALEGLAKYLDGLAPGDQHYAGLIRDAVAGVK